MSRKIELNGIERMYADDIFEAAFGAAGRAEVSVLTSDGSPVALITPVALPPERLADTRAIARMDDRDFDQYWSALGVVLRLLSKNFPHHG